MRRFRAHTLVLVRDDGERKSCTFYAYSSADALVLARAWAEPRGWKIP